MPISSTAAGRPFSGFLTPSPRDRGEALYRLSAMVAEHFAHAIRRWRTSRIGAASVDEVASVMPSGAKGLPMRIAGSKRRPIVWLALCSLVTLSPEWAQAQRITLAPVITTVAGQIGISGHSGDGGPAYLANLGDFGQLALDRDGNLYFSDNDFVRKIGARDGVITTVAGSGLSDGSTSLGGCYPGSGGDGGPAVLAPLCGPNGVVVTAAGQLILDEMGGSVVRSVDVGGIIATLVGGQKNAYVSGYSGDGGPARLAQITQPSGLALDQIGNLYVAENYNDVVRKVDGAGIISTFAGDFKRARDCEMGRIAPQQCDIGDNGLAVNAIIYSPLGMAADQTGNVYILEPFPTRVRKVDTNGTITTVAGTDKRGFSGDGGLATAAEFDISVCGRSDSDVGLAIDGQGNLYIPDMCNRRIRKVDPSGVVTTVVGNGNEGTAGDGGPALFAELSFPSGIAVDAAGSLYFRDTTRIRKVAVPEVVYFSNTALGSSVTQDVHLLINTALVLTGVTANGDFSVQGNSCALQAVLPAATYCAVQVRFAPQRAGVRQATLVAADGAGNRYTFKLVGLGEGSMVTFGTGALSTVAGTGTWGHAGDGGPATSATLRDPAGIKFDRDGNLFIVDNGDCTVRKVDTAGTISTVAGNGICGATYGGGPLGDDGGPATNAALGAPYNLALDSAGNIFLGETSFNDRVRRVDRDGTIGTGAGTGEYGFSGDGGPASQARFTVPWDVAVDGSDNLYIDDEINYRVRKVDSGGNISTVAGNGGQRNSGDGGPAIHASFGLILAIHVDLHGNLYISDEGPEGSTVRKVDPQGKITAWAGNGAFDATTVADNVPALLAPLGYPTGLTTDSIGNLYIANYGGSRISKVSPAGILTNVAGNGQLGLSGDGVPATASMLFDPWGVAVDHADNLYFSEIHAHRVRKIDTTLSALSFVTTPAHYVGSTSDPQSVRLTNDGNSSLDIQNFVWPPYFNPASVGNDCVVGLSIAPGESCNIGVTFTPQAPGDNIKGTLLVFDSALNSPQSIMLTGNAQAAPPPATVLNVWVETGEGYFSLFSSTRNRLPWKIKRIRVLFSQPITSGGPASLVGLPTTGVDGLGTTMLDWTFSPLTLGNFSASLATSGGDALRDEFGTAVAPMSFAFRVLWGDVNDDGVVSAADMVEVNLARYIRNNPFANLTDDEAIDLQDVQVVRSRIGTRLP